MAVPPDIILPLIKIRPIWMIVPPVFLIQSWTVAACTYMSYMTTHATQWKILVDMHLHNNWILVNFEWEIDLVPP